MRTFKSGAVVVSCLALVFLFVGLLFVAFKPAHDTAAKKELAKWEGSWDTRAGEKLTIKGDRWTSIAPGDNPISGKLKVIEIGEKLTHVDLLVEDGWPKGKTCKMILRLEGDTLHNCATYNKARPTEFKAEKKDDGWNVYYAWQRTLK